MMEDEDTVAVGNRWGFTRRFRFYWHLPESVWLLA